MLDCILGANFIGIGDNETIAVNKNNRRYNYNFVKQFESGECMPVSAKLRYICFENPFTLEPDDGFVITRIVDTNIISDNDPNSATITIKAYSEDELLFIIGIEYSDIFEDIKDEGGLVDEDVNFNLISDIKNSWYIGVVCKETDKIEKLYCSVGYKYQHEIGEWKDELVDN